MYLQNDDEVKTVRVECLNIRWGDENDTDIDAVTAAYLGLPREEDVLLDGTTGDWSDNGLVDQCADVLDSKYAKTGCHVLDLDAEVAEEI